MGRKLVVVNRSTFGPSSVALKKYESQINSKLYEYRFRHNFSEQLGYEFILDTRSWGAWCSPRIIYQVNDLARAIDYTRKLAALTPEDLHSYLGVKFVSY